MADEPKTRTGEEPPSQSVPYPTGSPPDPMEAVYIAHPELRPKDEPPPPTPAPETARKGAK